MVLNITLDITFLLTFQDRVSLCKVCCSETHSVDQAGFTLRDPLASASKVLGLKMCTTNASYNRILT